MNPVSTSGGNPLNTVLPHSNVDTLPATGSQQRLNSNNVNALTINAKAAHQKIGSAVQDPNALLNIHTPPPITQSLASAPGIAYSPTNDPDININSAIGANDFQARMREFIKTAEGSSFSQLNSRDQELLLNAFDACASSGAQDPSFNRLSNHQKIDALGLLKTCLENILRSGKPTSRLIDGSYPNEAAKRFLEEMLHNAEELLKQCRQNNQGIFSSAGNTFKDLVGANRSTYLDPNSSLAIPKNTSVLSTRNISDGNSNALSSNANAGNHATRTPKSPRVGPKLTSSAGTTTITPAAPTASTATTAATTAPTATTATTTATPASTATTATTTATPASTATTATTAATTASTATTAKTAPKTTSATTAPAATPDDASTTPQSTSKTTVANTTINPPTTDAKTPPKT